MADYQIGLIGQIDVAKSRKTISDSLKEVSKVIPSVDLKLNVDKSTKELKQILGDATSVVQSFNKEGQLAKTTLTGIDKATGQTVKVVQTLNKQTGELEDTFVTLSKSTGRVDEDFDKLNKRLLDLKNSGKSLVSVMSHYASKDEIGRANKLNDELQSMNDITKLGVGNADSLVKQLRNLSSEVKATGKNALNFGEAWKSAARSFSLWISVTSLFFAAIRAIKDGIKSVKEFDDAMLEVRKVTDLSEQSLSRFAQTSKLLAQDIGRTSTEVVKATASFARMGFAIEEATRLAKDALLLTNIGDGIDNVDESASAIIATLKGFNLEASQSSHVVDALNEVSNKFAVNTSDLTEGIRRVSAVMAQSGDTFDETLGLLTSMIEVMQDAPKAATALRTISMRLRGLEEDGTSLEANFTAKLEKDFQKIANTSLFMNGHLKSTTDIVRDLGSKWGELTGEEQAYLSQQVAGVRQAQAFNILMTQMQTGVDATKASMNSFGSAIVENDKYLNSISGKTALFKTELQQLWIDAINSNTIKSVVDLGTGLLKLIDFFGGLGTILPVVAVGLGLVFSVKIVEFFTAAKLAVIGFSTQITILGQTITLTAPVIAGLVLGITAVVKIVDTFTTSTQELQESIVNITNKLSDYKTKLEDLKTQKEQGADIDDRLIENLERQIALEEELFRIQNKKLAEKELFGGVSNALSDAKAIEAQYKFLINLLDEYDKKRKDGSITEEQYSNNVAKTIKSIDSLKPRMGEVIKLTQEYSDVLDSSPEKQNLLNIVDVFQEIILPQKEFIENQKESNTQSRDAIGIINEHNQELNDLKDTASDLADVWQLVADGEEITGIKLLEILARYPELNAYLDEKNGLTITAKELEEQLWQIEKQKFIDGAEKRRLEIEGKIESTEATIAEIIALQELDKQIAQTNLNKMYGSTYGKGMLDILGGAIGAEDPSKRLIKTTKELESLKKRLVEIKNTTNIVSSSTFSSFTGSSKTERKEKSSSKEKEKEIDLYKKYKMAIEETAYAIEILDKKIRLADEEDRKPLQLKRIELLKKEQIQLQEYSDAIRKRMKSEKLDAETTEELNAKLKENSSKWFDLRLQIKDTNDEMDEFASKQLDKLLDDTKDKVEDLAGKLKKELNTTLKGWEDYYKNSNDELQRQIDALDEQEKLQDQIDKDLQNQQKRQEILADIAQKQLDLAKAKSELENIKKQTPIRMLNEQGTAFTLVADRDAIAKKQEEIAGISKDILGLQGNLAEHDLSVTRELNKRKNDLEKERLRGLIEANNTALEDIKTSTQAQLESLSEITSTELDKQLELWTKFGNSADLALQPLIASIKSALSIPELGVMPTPKPSIPTIPLPPTNIGTPYFSGGLKSYSPTTNKVSSTNNQNTYNFTLNGVNDFAKTTDRLKRQLNLNK